MTLCFKLPRDRKQWSRKNGWSLPLHPLQVLAWFFLIMFAVLYFGVVVPSLPRGGWQNAAYVINCVVFLVHIIIHIISVSLNPADANVRAKTNSGPLPSFDRNKHNHVIENQYCYICEVKVGNKSKHCSACNKCVSEFDHHCKWLNNCVGGGNYRLFISCVSTALLGCLLIFVTSLALIIAYLNSRSWLYSVPPYDWSNSLWTSPVNAVINSTVDLSVSPSSLDLLTTSNPPINTTSPGGAFFVFVPVNKFVWLVIIAITTSLSLLAIALLGHLLGFHIFLMCQDLSTYDYIVQKRESTNTTNNNTDKPASSKNLLNCQLQMCRQIKTKKVIQDAQLRANQISPKGQETINKGEEREEWELQANTHHRVPETSNSALPVVTENGHVASNEEECSLDRYVGNVYIGSPHRRRHYLEPLYVRSRYTASEQHSAENKMETMDNIEKDDTSVAESEEEGDSSADSELQETNKDVVHSHSFSHGLPRRHLRSPSPAPLLSPILETEISTGSAIVSWRYRSVSEQSLHMLTEDDEDETSNKGTCSVQIENNPENIGLGNKEDSGSLSNLFLSGKEQMEETTTEDNNNIPQDSSQDGDNRVHEVHIIPQCSLQGYKFKENGIPEDAIKKIDCKDPFINGELWAYTPCNGGTSVPDGIISFRRSCSMQDNECITNLFHNKLTRCRSEDELKSTQRIVRLQRRLSEDQDLWMLQEDSTPLSKSSKEHLSKTGVSATAVFCVEEPDEPFQIPGITFGAKRKYNHFAVPNHIVLPCSNSVHPESRKRTRAVGAKPPKAFHA